MMKDKNGFTLMELLAVIVILGLIIIIAVPSVMNIMKTAKDKLSDYDKEALIDAAKFYITDVDNSKKSIEINNITYSGYEFKKYMNENGSVQVSAYTLAKGKYYDPGCNYDIDNDSECKVSKECTINVYADIGVQNGYFVTNKISAEIGDKCE